MSPLAIIHLCVIGEIYQKQPYLQRSRLGGSDIDIQFVLDRKTFLEYLNQHKPDLILCPRFVEDLSAQEVLDLLRQLHQTIPVIILGEVNDDERHIVPLIKAGAADYVTEARIDRLWDVVETALAASGKWTQKSYLAQINKASTPLIIFTLDTNGRFTMIRGSNTSLLPRSIQQTFASEFFGETPEVEEFFQQVANGATLSLRVEAQNRLWDIHCSPLRDTNGKQIGASGTAVDVTRSKTAIRQLAKTEKRWQAVFDDNNDVLLIVDVATGIIKETNHALKRIMGYDPESFIGKKFSGLLFPATRDHVHPESLISKDDMLANQILLKSDGTEIPMDITVTIMEWEDEKAALLTLRDISSRQAVEWALSDVQRLLNMVVSSAPVIVFSIDPSGVITNAEGKLFEQIGISSHELIGMSVFEVLRQYPFAIYDFERVLQGNLLHTIHHFSRMIFETFYHPVTDSLGKITSIVAVIVDITAYENAQSALLEAERMRLELAHERELITMREGFMSMITHEFRQPITTILGSSDILTLYHTRLDADGRTRHLTKITDQAKYMLVLLEDILTIITVRSGKLTLQPEAFNLFDLCIELIDHLGLGNENTKHHFVLGIGSDVGDVLLDLQLTRHIISNLLTNAIKYTPDGGTILLEVRVENENVCLTVQDTGIGIPEPDQRHLFEPFFRARNRGRIRGTGLGLALVQYSVEALGGTIEFNSRVDEGTTFVVQLPKILSAVTL